MYHLKRFLYVSLLLFSFTIPFLFRQKITAASYDELPYIKLYLTDGGRNMSDTPMVVEQINQYIKPILGFQVSIEYLPSSNYERILGQKFLSGEEFDILYCNSLNDSVLYQNEGWLLPLNDMLEQVPAFSSLFTKEYLSRLERNGELYVLPCYHDQAGYWGLEYNVDIAKDCGLDMTQVKSYSDLTDVFETVSKKRPDVFPVAETSLPLWDPLDNELGVLMDFSSPVVTNLYSSDFFEMLVKQNHEWYQAGYILDTVSYPASSIDYLSSGLVFGTITAGKPDIVSQESRITGIRIGYIPLTSAFTINDNITRGFFALNSRSNHAEYAMQFLNLMYSDKTLANLMTYGIEGIHYEFKDDPQTFIGFPENVNCTNSGYAKLLSWQCGSQILTYPWAGDPPDIWDQLKIFNETATVSAALGFSFDPTAVSEQIEACRTIQSAYRDGLIQGQLSPDYFLPRFLMELHNAGIDQIISEKQKQLNAFLG